MTTADLPDIQLSPMRVGTSQEGTQVLDRVLEIDRGKKDDILDLEKVGVEGRSEGEVSKEKPLEISDREKTTEGSVHTPISSERVSWVGVVQGEEGEISDVQNGEKVEETQVQVLQSQSSSPVESKEKIEETPEVEKNEEWLKISPGRASRSPSQQRDLQFGQVSLLTKSRFSVLEDEEEEVSETESERKSMEENKEKEEVRVSRQVLPRDSKMNHRYLRDKG
ncbi:hypothetical protein IGI04_006866, partial [Brassica rapa subsp. trilocularis]